MFQTIANTTIALVAAVLGLIASHPDRFHAEHAASRAPAAVRAADPAAIDVDLLASAPAWTCTTVASRLQ